MERKVPVSVELVVNQREELFECETENTHEPCAQTNIFVLDKERGCD